eukprot:COSAG05_NODE_12384_length_470_cov_0.725067_1_plen_99_part_00
MLRLPTTRYGEGDLSPWLPDRFEQRDHFPAVPYWPVVDRDNLVAWSQAGIFCQGCDHCLDCATSLTAGVNIHPKAELQQTNILSATEIARDSNACMMS